MDHPALKELVQYADGELAPAARAHVTTHLDACAQCRKQLLELSAVSMEIAAIDVELARSEQNRLAEQRTALQARLATETASKSGDAQRLRPALRWSRSLAYAAALMVLTAMGWILLTSRSKAHDQALALPNPTFTPGAVRPVSLNEICAANDDEVVRDVPAGMQQRVFREYGLSRAKPGDFEVDYLITPGLGGSDDVANLWPEPHRSQWNSYVKDQLEDHLHHMVCRGQLPLDAAQKEIAANWIAAYKKYFHTEEPLRAGVHGSGPADGSEEPLQRVALLR